MDSQAVRSVPLSFLNEDQPLSPVLSPSPPFWVSSFTPTPHPAQAPGPCGAAHIPFLGMPLGLLQKEGERCEKKAKTPPKQLMCHILLWSRHQKPKILLSETLNNRAFSISSLQEGIFEAQETLKTRWRMVKPFFCEQIPSSKNWMPKWTHRSCSCLSCCGSGPWGCSSQQFSPRRCGTTSYPAGCSSWYPCQTSSQQPQQSRLLSEDKRERNEGLTQGSCCDPLGESIGFAWGRAPMNSTELLCAYKYFAWQQQWNCS